MNISDVKKTIRIQLQEIYAAGEIQVISSLLIEHLFGLDKKEQIIHIHRAISLDEEEALSKAIHRLRNHEPIQYVVGHEYFMEHLFFVDSSVLIPRPETEELVHWVLSENKSSQSMQILDVGTGSGCMAIMLKKYLHQSEVVAVDISENALEVAKKNALYHQVHVFFQQKDFLKLDKIHDFEKFDLIVSNPPYIPDNERFKMKDDVLLHEPKEALFVPNDHPLIFYDAIKDFGLTHLSPNGKIYLECNPSTIEQVFNAFESSGYTVTIKKDLFGKDRFLCCILR